MKHNICLIDDDFPSNQLHELEAAQEFNLSNLKMLLREGIEWEDPELKELTTKISANSEVWNISAFSNPKWYIENCKQQFSTPELLILDWNYKSIDKSIEEYLMDILNQSFVIIWIYTRYDRKHEIEELLSREEYKEFSERIKIFHKEDNNLDELLASVDKTKNENFSFKFGRELRNATYDALEDILINLGKISIDNVIKILSDNENLEDLDVDLKYLLIEKLKNKWEENPEIERILRDNGYFTGKIHSFINMIAEKLKNIVNTRKFPIGDVKPDATIENNVIEKLWAYRLYYNPVDDFVRRGDVVKDVEGNLYVVITAACDLNRFWAKNLGCLNIAPIYDFQKDKEYIKAQVTLTKRLVDLKSPFNVSSLISEIKGLSQGPIVLPFIWTEDVFNNFILFPKELKSLHVKTPPSFIYTPKTFSRAAHAGKSDKEIEKLEVTFYQQETEREKGLKKTLKEESLSYTHCPEIQRISTISEPFLTPLTEHILFNIYGNGTPDYSKLVINKIDSEIKNLFT